MVNFIKPSLRTYFDKLKLINDLSNGFDAITQAGNEYLPQGERESDRSFKTRLKHNSPQDYFNTTIKGISGLIFNTPISYQDTTTIQDEFIDNADSMGSHFDLILSRLTSTALAKGIAYVLVDTPPKAESLATQNKPYIVNIEPENIINFRTEIINGETVLSMVVIRELIEVPKDEFESEIVEQFRVLNRGSYRLYRVKDKTETLIEEGETGLDYIPLFNLDLSDSGKFMESEPPFYNLGRKNIELYSLESDSRWNYHTASVPMLTAMGFDDNDLKGLTISANTLLHHHNPDSKIEWLDYKADALKFGMDMATTLRTQIAQMGLSAVTNGKVEVTATQSMLDNIKTQSQLFTYARKIKDTAELILLCVNDVMGQSGGATVEINIDIVKGTLDPQEMTAYVNMVNSGIISLETIWSILAKGGKLGSEFDADVEKERIRQDGLMVKDDTI